MFCEASETRNTTASAMLPAVVTRRRAISCTYSARTCSGVHPRVRAFSRQSRSIRGPSTIPGCSALTLTLCGPTSSATVRVRPRSAHFDDEYAARDRKSTRLNSSHLGISYAVFCLKKKVLPTLVVDGVRAEVVVADPPRADHHPKALHALATLAPARLVYVSLNPAPPAREIGVLVA